MPSPTAGTIRPPQSQRGWRIELACPPGAPNHTRSDYYRKSRDQLEADVRVVNGQDRHGRWYEEFLVGDVFLHWPGQTITELENHSFTHMTGNLSATHTDEVFAKSQGHKSCLVNGGLVLSVVHGLSVLDLSSAPKAIAQLEWTNIKIYTAVYPGDTLYAASKVLEKRESRSRNDRGIVSVRTRGVNQNGDLVIDFARTIMVHKQPADPQPPLQQKWFQDWLDSVDGH